MSAVGDARKRAQEKVSTPDDEKWECGPHTNSWKGHDARCRRIHANDITDPTASTPDDREAPELVIDGGWLCEVANKHTCGTAASGYYGAHEPGCGLVPIADIRGLLAEHDAQVRAEALDVCAALLDRVVTYWGGRPLSAGHGVNLYADVRDVLRGIERDRDHNRAIARQSVEGGA